MEVSGRQKSEAKREIGLAQKTICVLPVHVFWVVSFYGANFQVLALNWVAALLWTKPFAFLGDIGCLPYDQSKLFTTT